MDSGNALEQHLEVVRCTCSPFAHRRKLERNMNILTEKNQQLIAMETDIMRRVGAAEDEGSKEVVDKAAKFLEDVVKVKLQVNGVERSLEEKKKCFSDRWSHRKLAKHVIELVGEVDRLLGETSGFANELVEQSPPRALTLPTTSLVGKSTVEKNVDAILNSLRNPMIGKIGIYGMGGCGKTTTMMNIHNQLIKTKEFKKIVWVTVSKDLNLNKLQNLIAEQLNNMDLSTCWCTLHGSAPIMS